MKKRQWILFLVFMGIAVNVVEAQSVADVARKERERQKTARSSVVVAATGSTTTSQGVTGKDSSAAPSNAAKPFEATDNKGRDEKFWRAAFQKARDDAKRAEARAEILDLRVKDLNTQMLRQSDMYNREYRLNPEIAAVQKQFEEVRREVDQARKKIFDLEEDLRRSGGPAGWSR